MARRLGAFSAACFITRCLDAAAAGPFPCPSVEPAIATPKDVSELHPAHVSVVMAIGDSITAAFAADTLLGVGTAAVEFRKYSFSGGEGSDEHWTLPYFFGHYNASLVGFSTHWALPQTPTTGYYEPDLDALNVALTNAHSFNLPMQVDELLTRSQSVPGFDDRWKVLTILIGANDLCDGISSGFEACDGDASHATALADRYEKNLQDLLGRIRDSFRNIVVELASIFSIASVKRARSGHLWCDIRPHVLVECNCIDKPVSGDNVSDAQLDSFDATVAMFNERIHAVASQFHGKRADFAVVEAVASKGQKIPDISYLSGLDCFHPSAKAHSDMARVLWNSVFDTRRLPQANVSEPLFCPTSESVLYTGMTPSPLKLRDPDSLRWV